NDTITSDGIHAVFAQTSAWEVVLYLETRTEDNRPTSGEFVVLTANGISARFPVPLNFYGDKGATRTIAISPDRRFAAFQSSALTEGSPPLLTFVDITTGAC